MANDTDAMLKNISDATHDDRLSLGAKALYTYLETTAEPGEIWAKEVGQTQAQISRALKCSPDTIRNHAEKLKAAGFIEIEQRHDEEYNNLGYRYCLVKYGRRGR